MDPEQIDSIHNAEKYLTLKSAAVIIHSNVKSRSKTFGL